MEIDNFNLFFYHLKKFHELKSLKYEKACIQSDLSFWSLYAYLVVISPPEWVRKEIAFLKKELNSITEIGDRNLHSIGHITLIDNLTDDPELKDSVAKMVQFTEPFLIRLQNVNTFNHGKYSTLFIDVENPNPIINVMKSLKSPYKTPHLSIAKRVPNDQAEKSKKIIATY